MIWKCKKNPIKNFKHWNYKHRLSPFLQLYSVCGENNFLRNIFLQRCPQSLLLKYDNPLKSRAISHKTTRPEHKIKEEMLPNQHLLLQFSPIWGEYFKLVAAWFSPRAHIRPFLQLVLNGTSDHHLCQVGAGKKLRRAHKSQFQN